MLFLVGLAFIGVAIWNITTKPHHTASDWVLPVVCIAAGVGGVGMAVKLS